MTPMGQGVTCSAELDKTGGEKEEGREWIKQSGTRTGRGRRKRTELY